MPAEAKCRGRPKKYFSEEERKEANKESRRKHRETHIWFCTACNRDYPTYWKSIHMESNKQRNSIITDKIKDKNDRIPVL